MTGTGGGVGEGWETEPGSTRQGSTAWAAIADPLVGRHLAKMRLPVPALFTNLRKVSHLSDSERCEKFP